MTTEPDPASPAAAAATDREVIAARDSGHQRTYANGRPKRRRGEGAMWSLRCAATSTGRGTETVGRLSGASSACRATFVERVLADESRAAVVVGGTQPPVGGRADAHPIRAA